MTDRIGPYKIQEKLGQGTMGVVYRARHQTTNATVALKTVHLPAEALLAAIRREIHALARLDHPGIIRILDEGVEKGIPWYTMPLIDGDTLRHRISKGPMPQAEWIPLIQKLCFTLSFIHGEGMVHRDLKPENILITPSGEPVLTDFGLMTYSGGETSRELLELAEITAGAVAYLAPEQIRGEGVDARSDLYALGCILYEIISKHPPFVGSNARDIFRAHLEATPAPLHDVQPQLESMVMRLLAKATADRTGYAEDVAQQLAQLGGRLEQRTGPASRIYLYRPRLAGRTTVMEEVRDSLSRLEQGHGGVLLIGGESGAGKTRLLLETAREAGSRGLVLLSGECSPDSGTPLQAFRTPLRMLADRCLEHGIEMTERIFGNRGRILQPYQPALASLPGLDRHATPAELPAEAARLRVFRALAQTMEALAEDWPVLLVLDDLQWADDLSAGFLEFLVRTKRTEVTELLVVGAYRSEETPDWLTPLLEHSRSLSLNKLDEDAIGSMVSDMLALKSSAHELVPFLAGQSEGNPFFVAEYLRTAATEGMLQRNSEGRWQVPASGLRAALPVSVQSLIERRLQMLTPQASILAEAAAVLGRTPDHAVLMHASDLDEVNWMEALDELLRRQVLQEESEDRLRFVHDKIRDVVYLRLDAEHRRQLHRQAAAAIETEHRTERDEYLATLAEHYQHCGESRLACECYNGAAQRAVIRYSYHEAEKLYRALLDLEVRPTQRAAALKELADLYRVSGRLEDAKKACEEALQQIRTLADRAEEGRCLSLLAAIYWPQGRLAEAGSICLEALSIHRERQDRAGEGKTLASLAAIRWSQGLFEDARSLYEQALALHRELGDRRQEGSDLSNLAVMDLDQGRLDEGAMRFEEALRVQRETGDRRFEGVSLSNLANIRLYQGRKEEARELFEQAVGIQRQVSDRRSEGATLNNLAWMEMEKQNWHEARKLYEEALAAQREVGDRLFEAHTIRNLAQLERESAGDLARSAEMLMQATALFTGLQNWPGVALCLCEQGHLALNRGHSAVTFLKQARMIAAQAGMGPESELGLTIKRLEEATAKPRKTKTKQKRA